MANRVSVLFALLVALHAAHMVSSGSIARSIRPPTGYVVPPKVSAALNTYVKFVKKPSEVKEKVDDISDLLDMFLEQYEESQAQGGTALPAGSYYLELTSIMVGGKTLPKYNGKGGAIVSENIHIAFLTEEAYGVLENHFQGSQRLSKYGLLCRRSTAEEDKLQSVTLALAVADNGSNLKYPWYKMGDGATICLPVMPLP